MSVGADRERTRRGAGRLPRGARALLSAAAATAALALAFAVGWATHAVTDARPDDPPRVDALLVLYSQPRVYDAAIELAAAGVADRLFVSAHLGPDGHERLCGPEGRRDPRLAGVSVECFAPDPVTTQGEVMHAAARMRELGLEHLGVLTFHQHLERSRLLAERCWTREEGRVSLYAFDAGLDRWGTVRHGAYGVLAYGKAMATPGCDQELPGVLQWPLDLAKGLRGQPVGAGASLPPAVTPVAAPAPAPASAAVAGWPGEGEE